MKKRMELFVLLAGMLFLSACMPERAEFAYPEMAETDSMATVAIATPTPTPEPTPEPAHDYGRDRAALGEYVYLADETFHEVECPLIYGELHGILFAEAERKNYSYCDECVHLGDTQAPSLYYNQEFERSMNVKMKINLRDSSGVYDIVYVTTGDEAFDLNNLLINDRIRNWYKEFEIDPESIRVYTRSGNSYYHNTLCEEVSSVSNKEMISLAEAFSKKLKACTKCMPPTSAWTTLPVKADDHYHYYYVGEAFIKKALQQDKYELPPEMNIDVDRMLDDYFD